MEPDGTTRVVEYIADDHGFRAVVKKIGTPVHPAPSPIVHHPAPIVAAPIPAPAPQPIVVQEPQPVFYDGYDAYNGQYENYVPALPSYAAGPTPVEIPKVVAPPVYQTYQPVSAPAPATLQAAPFFPLQSPVEERVEYHGFTGNADDDSAYTQYGQQEGANGEGLGYERGYSFEETRPQLVSIPYKFVEDYQKPILYYSQQKY